MESSALQPTFVASLSPRTRQKTVKNALQQARNLEKLGEVENLELAVQFYEQARLYSAPASYPATKLLTASNAGHGHHRGPNFTSTTKIDVSIEKCRRAIAKVMEVRQQQDGMQSKRSRTVPSAVKTKKKRTETKSAQDKSSNDMLDDPDTAQVKSLPDLPDLPAHQVDLLDDSPKTCLLEARHEVHHYVTPLSPPCDKQADEHLAKTSQSRSVIVISDDEVEASLEAVSPKRSASSALTSAPELSNHQNSSRFSSFAYIEPEAQDYRGPSKHLPPQASLSKPKCAATKSAPPLLSSPPLLPAVAARNQEKEPSSVQSTRKRRRPAKAEVAGRDRNTAKGKSPKKDRKKPAAARTNDRVKLKDTVTAASERGIEALALTLVSDAAFKLLDRCPFCLGRFTKSAAGKSKREHASLCAPLLGIDSDPSATHTIEQTLKDWMQNQAELDRQAQEARTVLDQMVGDADVVVQEGRASQIEASPKKKGHARVTMKKAITRTAKPIVIGDTMLLGPASRIWPAKDNKALARARADLILGPRRTKEASDTDNTHAAGSSGIRVGQPFQQGSRSKGQDRQAESTRQDTRTHTGRKEAESPSSDCNSSRTCQLPTLPIDDDFANIRSPQRGTSPVKALRMARDRRERSSEAASPDMPMRALADPSSNRRGSHSILEWIEHTRQSQDDADKEAEAALPSTQKFAPSKLGQRNRSRAGPDRPSLFGAEPVSDRSLLDLIKAPTIDLCTADREAVSKSANDGPSNDKPRSRLISGHGSETAGDADKDGSDDRTEQYVEATEFGLPGAQQEQGLTHRVRG
ncbi:hypothetical protein BCV70DRAFT_231570 [Testicularia cyperi]|uniref:Uncharacterized protein n=1 Tax=Testicularia cyperi TaxID=1882483 RepID=A0A317XR26_9BASI|nr:hypothetical protein BCV70DRAFT_231570 [Testicularia cyperi]